MSMEGLPNPKVNKINTGEIKLGGMEFFQDGEFYSATGNYSDQKEFNPELKAYKINEGAKYFFPQLVESLSLSISSIDKSIEELENEVNNAVAPFEERKLLLDKIENLKKEREELKIVKQEAENRREH